MVETAAERFSKDHVPGQLIKEQDKLKALLEQNRCVTSAKNLYEHVIDVMDFLVIHYPDEALEKFEEVSYLIKKGDNAKLEQFLCTEDKRNYAQHCSAAATVTAKYITRASAFFSVKTYFSVDLYSYRPQSLKLLLKMKSLLVVHWLQWVSSLIFAPTTSLSGSGPA
jgi:hypothetical protein